MKNVFSFLTKKHSNENEKTVTFMIDGMHCVSCSLNIDMALEETNGVLEATTHFASGKTTVTYDPRKVTLDALESAITKTGYTVQKRV